MPTRASGEPAALCLHSLPQELPHQLTAHPTCWQAGGRAACHLSPILLLVQVLKLDTGLVSLKAEGQELLLELEKNQ